MNSMHPLLSAQVSLCCWNTELSNPTEYVLRTSCDGNEHMSEVESDWLDDLGSGFWTGVAQRLRLTVHRASPKPARPGLFVHTYSVVISTPKGLVCPLLPNLGQPHLWTWLCMEYVVRLVTWPATQSLTLTDSRDQTVPAVSQPEYSPNAQQGHLAPTRYALAQTAWTIICPVIGSLSRYMYMPGKEISSNFSTVRSYYLTNVPPGPFNAHLTNCMHAAAR